MHNLEKGEQVDIEMRARIGTAKEHSRWCPVSQCAFYNRIDEDKAKEAFIQGLYELNEDPNITDTMIERFKQKFETLDKYRHFHTNQYGEPCKFHFQIESECRLSPGYMFGKAIHVLIDKMRTFSDKLPSLKVSQDVTDNYSVEIPNEDYTLVNTLQCLVYNHCIREKDNDGYPLSYIGYYQTHPLDQKMIVRMRFDGTPYTNKDIQTFLHLQVDKIISYLQTVYETWVTESRK